MRAFLWTMLILAALTSLAKATWLARGEFPKRTAATEVINLIGDMVLLGWCAYFLLTGD